MAIVTKDVEVAGRRLSFETGRLAEQANGAVLVRYGDSVVLSGSVANAGESQSAFEMASKLAGGDAKVVNGLTIRGRDQIMLRVTVAEVQRVGVKTPDESTRWIRELRDRR